MKRTLSLLACLTPLVGLPLAGCAVDNGQSVIISRWVSFSTTNNCVADPGNMVSRSGGTLDTGLVATLGTHGFFAAPVVENHMPSTVSGGTTTDVERNGYFVTGYEIELAAAPGGTLPALTPSHYQSAVATTYVAPGSTTSEFVELIPSAIALQLDAAVMSGWAPSEVLVKVRALGTHGSENLPSGWSTFPVSICHYCLANPTVSCPAGLTSSSVVLGGCFSQQDEPITCCCNHHSDPQTCDDIRCGSRVPTTTNGGTSLPDGGL